MDNNGIVGEDKPTSVDNAREKSNKDKVLKIVLGVLVFCVVGLIIGVAVVQLSKGGGNDDNSCVNKEGFEEIGDCINAIYNEGGMDAALVEYDATIDKAYDDNDESLFYQLTISRSLMLSANGKCIEAVELLDDSKIDDLPVSPEKGVFYSRAIGVCSSCGDDKKAEVYQKKLMEAHKEYDE